ncbi:MAG: ABC transporter permease [SAR324 cluster bacterium]|nr:ABC transporter permease [SAR324 cluster bacterium]
MNGWRSLAWTVTAIGLGFAVGGVLVAAFGHDPWLALTMMLSGAFGSSFDFATTLASSIPLALTGLAVALAFQAGLFNIGASGQFWLGAIAATWVGYSLPLPALVHPVVALLAAMLAGALWAAVIPGLAKVHRGAHEVITTLMLTYIAVELGHFLLEKGPMMTPGFNPESPKILESAHLPTLVSGTQLSAGLLLVPLCAGVGWLLLFRTPLGFGLRMTGHNPRAARYAGVSPTAATLLALALSGAFAGLAGGILILGVEHRLHNSFDVSYGFTGIVVALLARNHPIGVIPAALLFGALDNGAQAMQIFAEIPANLTEVIKGSIIFFVAAEGLGRWLFERRTRLEGVGA